MTILISFLFYISVKKRKWYFIKVHFVFSISVLFSSFPRIPNPIPRIPAFPPRLPAFPPIFPTFPPIPCIRLIPFPNSPFRVRNMMFKHRTAKQFESFSHRIDSVPYERSKRSRIGRVLIFIKKNLSYKIRKAF